MSRTSWASIGLACLSFFSLEAADLTMNYVQPASATMDWDGYGDQNGDGSMTMTGPGDTQSATLSVLCNSLNGYKVFFNSSNATSATSANLVMGGYDIGYTAAMNTSGITNATITTSSLVLNNPTSASLNVNFNGVGDQLPLVGSTEANEVQLQLTLDSFDGNLLPAGTYQDVITATIALN